MSIDDLRTSIERGDVEGVRAALKFDAELANQTIRWTLNQENESDPLHYVSDCVGNGWLTNGQEGPIAKVLLAYGAAINGTRERESPLIGSASLGVERVSRVLVEEGADLELTSLFGARALHWAAWLGTLSTVDLLVKRGAAIEARCSEFGGTPLFWAVHGYGPNGPKEKREQVGAALALIDIGAEIETRNRNGLSAIELSKGCDCRAMHELLVGRLKR
jgi:ankyrin repeat protein